MKRIYNWKPSLPDARDFQYHLLVKPLPTVPVSIDPLTAFIAAYDQGQLGSCTGNGNARVFAHRYYIETKVLDMFARLFAYYNGRLLEDNTGVDSGAQVRDVMKGMAKYGMPLEKDWPYIISKFAVTPPKNVYAIAKKELALRYMSVKVDLNTIKQSLAQGNPLVFGFTVFNSFESNEVAQSGVMPMPKKGEKRLDGHCVVMDGYSDAKQILWCENSWGTGWGQQGRFTMPYAFLNYCSDFWNLTKVAA